MFGWLTRTVVAALGMLLGALLGSLLAPAGFWHDLWLIGGGLAGVVLASGVDRLRARRIMNWLRDPRAASAPLDAGLFGEIAYRIERVLRERDRSLEAEQERLRQFLQGIEASPNGVMLLDAADQIEWCNAQAADHFGLDPQRDRLQRVTNLIRAPAFVAYLQGGRYQEQASLPDPLQRRTINVLIRPYGSGSKLVLSQDVTDIERSEAMRRDFVANVSHEIRTPLTVVAGFVETLATIELDPDERRHVLALMAQQTRRMQALVADLLQLAQLEGSPRPALDRWVTLGELLRRAQTEAHALSGGRHRLHFDAAPGVDLAGSEAEVHSAVANLVSNAIRYTPEGGQIFVAWGWRDDGSGTLSVRDNGPGIAREHLGRLTERFYRVDHSRSRDSGGTGLGLAIVKHVMQRHGGEILIESEVGAGSVFTLVWPANRLRRAEPPQADAA
jgi:two-component system phosphate regulon sensor histidine kinase PhoR